MGYVGGLPPTLIVPLLQKLGALICTNEIVKKTICYGIYDIIFGIGASQSTIVSLLYFTKFL